MSDLTTQYRTLRNHINHNKGAKTVCVTTCLNFFNIPFDSYQYTSSYKNVSAYKNVLRRNGYSVRSRKSEFKVKLSTTLTQLKRNVKNSGYTKESLFVVHLVQSKTAHLVVINGLGEVIIDTARGLRWKVSQISIVERD